ncbi:MAG TPA: phosphomannose isomerase type II C-terminal cupin domain [Candidatus Paceibacterota bacterium]
MNSPQPHNDFRPWGQEVWLTDEKRTPSMVKIITVKPGEQLSLQYHSKRDECWYVISGNGSAELDGARTALNAGTSVFAPRMTKHRIFGGSEPLVFVECAYGDFDESDIVRLEDKYGRT